MRRQFILVAALAVGLVAAKAQQGPLLTFYRHNWALLNPAALPRNYFEDQDLQLHISGASRAHTVFSEGFPQHHNVRVEGIPNTKSNDIKLGLYGSLDAAGALAENRIQGNFAYAFPLDYKGRHQFSIGGTLSWTNQRVNLNKVNFQTDPNVPLDIASRSYWDLNVGVFYYRRADSGTRPGIRRYAVKNRTYENQPPFYAGISTIQLVSRGLSNNPAAGTGFTSPFQPHYYAVVGGVVKQFEPSVWVRYLPGLEYHTWGFSNPLSVDFNVRHIIKQTWVGAGVSTNGLANVEAGIRIWLSDESKELLQIGFAAGHLGISSKRLTAGMTMELSLGISL